MTTAVVTGANGHIGFCLVKLLLERGRQVLALDLEASPWLRDLGVEVRLGDIRDAAFMRSCLEQGDTLFHLASVISVAGDKGGLVPSVNIDGARNVAQAALEAGVRRMVHFSSIHAFDIDQHGTIITEETRPATMARAPSAYNRSKALGQKEVLALVPLGLDVVVVNPCGVIGPYDYKVSLQGAANRRLMAGRREPHAPGGFNWVDARDVALGALLAEEKGRAGACYILGGHYRNQLEFAQTVSRVTGVPTSDKLFPMWLLRILATLLGFVERWTGAEQILTHEGLDTIMTNPDISIAKATRELGYQPRPLEETLLDIYRWYQDTDQLPGPG